MGVSLINLVRRAVFVLFIIANLPSINVDAQMTPEGGELLDFIATEQQRGSVLTYSQSYVDDENERVSYNGTLYAGIHLFKLDESDGSRRHPGSIFRRYRAQELWASSFGADG